jgi:hypothetical protein
VRLLIQRSRAQSFYRFRSRAFPQLPSGANSLPSINDLNRLLMLGSGRQVFSYPLELAGHRDE